MASLNDFGERRVLRELFLSDEAFIAELADLLQIEADGGDSPASYLQWAMQEAWRLSKIKTTITYHQTRLAMLKEKI